MTSINLYQDSAQQGGEKKTNIINGGFIVSLGLLIVTLLVLGGLKIYSGILEKQNVDITAQIQTERTSTSGNSALDKITDFKKRVDSITTDIASKEYVKDILGNVASTMVAGTMLTNFAYDSGKVTTIMNVDNFQDVAKQISSFKQSTHFSNVSVTGITRGEKGIALSTEMINKQ
jgi:hypothetical protein